MSDSENMGFLLISEGGDGLGLALRLKAEGHKTSMWIRDPMLEGRGEGLVEKGNAPDFTPVVIADCTGSGALLDTYRDADALTFGGSQIADKLESDRKYASSIMKECGIKQPQAKSFNSWEDASHFVESQDDSTRLVFKPEGHHSGNLPSYVSYDRTDMLHMLEHYKTIIGEAEAEFILQEFISGTCISSEGWFSKDHFIKPFNHTFERKQFLNDDLGPSGGCTGNVVWACLEDECPLCENLLRLEDFLTEVSYNGPIDINSVVSKVGEAYALEFTPRFGYDAFPTFLYGLFDGSFGEFVWDCARGAAGDTMPLRKGYAAGVRISTPPWPSEDFESKKGLPIGNLRFKDLERFYPYEVSLQEDNFITSGGVGIIGVAVGYSENSIDEAFEEAYKLCKKIRLPDMQYRTDLAEQFKSDLRRVSRYLTLNV
jgi:phosphoribosylamine-glycine ligase